MRRGLAESIFGLWRRVRRVPAGEVIAPIAPAPPIPSTHTTPIAAWCSAVTFLSSEEGPGGAEAAPPNSDVDPRYALRLADVRPVGDLAPHEEFMETDIVAYDSMRAACHEIDVVVHLAAYPGDGAEFYDVLLRLNMIGAYNAIHAAHEAGCKRVIFASSIDAVMGYAAHLGIENVVCRCIIDLATISKSASD